MKRLCFSLMLTLLAVVAFAADPPRVKTKCGPWVVGVTETEMTVVWTSTDRCMGWVEVAPDDGTSFYAEERPRYDEDFMGRHVVSAVHHVRITGLKPGTSYRYRIYQQGVDDSGHNPVPSGYISASNVYSQKPYAIRTMDAEKEDCTFTMVNDIHGRDSMMLALTKGLKEQKPDFVVFNGDMVSFMGSVEDIETGFMTRATETFATDVPLVYVRGNHETRGPGFSEYLNLFPTPTNTPYFTFRQGPVAFVVLDSGEDKPDSDIEYGGTAAYDAYREQMAEWLKEAVKSEEFRSAPVKIALLHIPFDKGVGWYGNNELKRLLLPTLNEAGIDVMLCGHTHTYSYRDVGSVDNNFPILVNSNNDKVNVRATKSQIDMEVVDATGKVLHRHTVKVE
ncbi:MAG: FN3 domain-containing metallophosphoesterase family protein [Rikenellaceae bacterium]|nr:metallophosphoesterase [Alistipes sp.]MDO5488025.1 FN3 domain-containing metallophosphoesterase family protein [Rikenellaceae bacterium]